MHIEEEPKRIPAPEDRKHLDEWVEFYCLPIRWQSFYRARCGSARARSLRYLWTEQGNWFLFKAESEERDFVVATGEELHANGVRGHGRKHSWIVYDNDYAAIAWNRLIRGLTGYVLSEEGEAIALVGEYKDGDIRYEEMVKRLIQLSPSRDVLNKVKGWLGYKEGWVWRMENKLREAS